MNRTTERYLRSHGQWVKVTRNPAARTFTLARGWGRVERELNVHAKTVYRWLTGRCEIPGHQRPGIYSLS